MSDTPARAAPTGTDSAATLEARLETLAADVQQVPSAVVAELAEIAAAATAIGADGLAGDAAYLTARARVNLGDIARALTALDAARTSFDRAGRRLDAIRTGLGRMHALDELGRHADAIDVGRQIVDEVADYQRDHPGRPDPGVVRLAAAALENVGVSWGSLGRHRDALTAYEEAMPLYTSAGFDVDAARCGANRGVELLELGNAADAIEPLRTAVPTFIDQDDALFAGLCKAYEASAHTIVGDFGAALRALELSDELLHGAEATSDFGRAQLLRANTLVALNLLPEARELFERLDATFADSGLRHERARALIGRAYVLVRSGATDRAAELYREADEILDDVGDQALRSVALIGRSHVGTPDERRRAASDALLHAQRTHRRADEVAARLRSTELDDDDAATELRICSQICSDIALPHLEWQVERAWATYAVRSGDRSDARIHLRRAGEIVETLRSTVRDEQLLMPFLGSRRDVHEDLVRLLLDDGDVAAALSAVRAARSRSLVERTRPASSLGVGRAGATLGAPVSDTGAFVAGAQDRASLPSGWAHVVYEIVGDELLAFVQRGDTVAAVRHLTDTTTLDRLQRRLVAAWRKLSSGVLGGHDTSPVLADVTDVLRRLHDLIIAPLPGLDGATRLIVVPVGGLANVPFAALHDGTDHLIAKLPIAVAASLPATARSTQRGPRRLLIGVPDDDAPLVAREIAAIASIRELATSTTVALGSLGNTDTLVRELPGHDIVHIAAHGHNRPDNPALSSLQFADRALTAQEITHLPLDGQLVVLSACSSGRQHTAGNVDELLGLPRAFLAAGAGDVVVNLWQVDDAGDAELMAAFHRHHPEVDPVVALWRAQLEVRARRPNPYVWAAPVVYVGNSSSPAAARA